jgi:hypothetical protein
MSPSSSAGAVPECATLGDLLKVFAELLPHEVATCSKLINSLRLSDALTSLSFGAEAMEVCRANIGNAREAADGRDTTLDSTAMDPGKPQLSDMADVPLPNAESMIVQTGSICPGQDRGGLGDLKEAFPENDPVPSTGDLYPAQTGTPSAPLRRNSWRSTPFFPDESHGGLRKRVFLVFDEPDESQLGKFIALLLIIAIGVSTVSFIMESMPEFRYRLAACATHKTVANCEPIPKPAFAIVEAGCIAIFTVDYLIRMSTVHSVPSKIEGNAFVRTLMYVRQPLNMIDLIAILPFYLNFVIGGGVGPMRALRLARILRLFKTAKHHPGMRLLAEVLMMSGQPLLILVFFNVIITILFGALIWFSEGMSYSVAPQFTAADVTTSMGYPMFPTGVYVRPDMSLTKEEVSPFRSIPYSVWWVLTTMTTVGYGDYSPTTYIGKCIGVVCFYVGIIFLALPISVIGTNFEIVYHRTQKEKQRNRAAAALKKAEKKQTLKSARSGVEKIAKRDNPGWFPESDERGIRFMIFTLLEDPGASRVGKYISIFVIIVIVISTTSFVLESMPEFRYTSTDCNPVALTVESCEPRPQAYFFALELVCIVIFTVDYVLRAATVHVATLEECGLENPGEVNSEGEIPEPSGLKITGLYLAQVLNVIDLLAIVPFYVELCGGGGGGASVLRVLRLVRIFRVLRMPKMRACAEMFISVVFNSLPALLLLVVLTLLMCVMFASLVVFAEGSWYSVDHFKAEYPYGVYIRPTKDGYDLEPSPFQSILYAFWWFFTTATTVGYGDDVPTTTAGRVVGVTTFYTGIVLIALPITIVGGEFSKLYPDWVKEFGSQAAMGGEQSLDGVRNRNPSNSSQSDLAQIVPCGSSSPDAEVVEYDGEAPSSPGCIEVAQGYVNNASTIPRKDCRPTPQTAGRNKAWGSA